MTKARDTKPHIGIFGRRNNGKSSLINALTGQDIAIVSEVAGTTTDPVKKSIEIAGIGPVVMIDTAGIDDSGELGLKRVSKTKEVLKIIDMAILLIAHNEFDEPEKNLVADFQANDLPFLIIHNKSDEEEITSSLTELIGRKYGVPVIGFSALFPKTDYPGTIKIDIENTQSGQGSHKTGQVPDQYIYGADHPIHIQDPPQVEDDKPVTGKHQPEFGMGLQSPGQNPPLHVPDSPEHETSLQGFNSNMNPPGGETVQMSNQPHAHTIDDAAIVQINKPVSKYNQLHPHRIEEVIKLIRETIPETSFRKQTLVGDLISYGDVVLLITPIDIEAPEGRMILPQMQVIRDVLDHDGIAVVCKEREVDAFLKKMNPKPVLVVTDSQVFPKADAAIPKDIPLTSFSIVLARQKGDFANYLRGTPHLSKLRDGDRLLILESCTHHVSCDDIGRVKIPRWLNNFSGKKLEFDIVAGLNKITRPITDYAMVIQCGGCMITRKQIVSRLKPAIDAGIPVTNYGMAIAFVHGIYNRAIAPFAGGQGDGADYL